MLSISERPQILSEVCGHKSVKTYLKGCLDGNEIKLPNVMFFTGSTGLGKTTLTKIIAKTINCHKPVKNKDGYFDPCNECGSCKDIMSEKFNRDVIFYSGSVDKTDSVSKVTDRLSYPANYEKNTIVIVDEVQNLHDSALSVFLNETEKTKSNVYFIFLSMDAGKKSKALNALYGRSQKFNLTPPSQDDIIEYVINMLEKNNMLESIPVEFFSEGLPVIVNDTSLGLRGIIQNVERCIMSKLWTEKEISQELGIVSESTLFKMIDSLLNKDESVIFDLQNIDVKTFYESSKAILMKALQFKVYNPDNNRSGVAKYSFHRNIIDLINNVYLKTENSVYYTDNIFIANVCLYLMGNNVKVLNENIETKQEVKPVRQRVPVIS